MWRLNFKGDEGATAVASALCMVALLGIVALVIDVGAIFSEKAQLQNGADAAALAVAQSCIKSETTCMSGSSLAQPLANANSLDGASAVKSTIVDLESQTVTVTTSNETETGNHHLSLSVARIFGVDAIKFDANAEASWGSLHKGPAGLGLAFAQCEFNPKDSGPQALYVHGGQNSTCDGVTNSSGQKLPGGFGWLTSPGASCQPEISVGDEVSLSDTGLAAPKPCEEALQLQQNQVVWLPVYGWKGGTGATGQYEIISWAGFELLAYSFPGFEWPAKKDGNPLSDRGIYGNFIEFRDKPPGFELGPTSPYGTTVFSLTK